MTRYLSTNNDEQIEPLPVHFQIVFVCPTASRSIEGIFSSSDFSFHPFDFSLPRSRSDHRNASRCVYRCRTDKGHSIANRFRFVLTTRNERVELLLRGWLGPVGRLFIGSPLFDDIPDASVDHFFSSSFSSSSSVQYISR